MKKLLLILVLAAALAYALYRSGDWLVADRPQQSDAIVVLAGDINDVRYGRGLQLLREGYGQNLRLDASADLTKYGRTWAEAASDFVGASAGDLAPRAAVCPIAENSTVAETKYVDRCLEELHPQSVLLVTSDFHTARALSIFSHKLPQYRWSAAAARDPKIFGERWWQHREWAKNWLMEWERTLWWHLVDRWRK
jgi:hypothetical protein